ncbi:TetR/AcrR family transcriptional regulator [Microbacterium rhizophilus]|uniref:TetR/AcrR family transcriptional regulator n=1 Tax=Microbacterium rhizophilus TaxID=3138934 RepID=UPI0031E8C30C
MSTVTERAQKAKVDKFAARRSELADAALSAIADGGFARTGLRDIAARVGLSHGVLHYYFRDKDDLIAHAVWQYKSECARRYDPVVATATTASELADGFAAEMASTLQDDADMHRLWYDLRTQAMYEEGFRDTIVAIDALLTDMVWTVLRRYADLAGREIAIERDEAYALVDGAFLNALIAFLRGDLDSPARLQGTAARLLAAVLR